MSLAPPPREIEVSIGCTGCGWEGETLVSLVNRYDAEWTCPGCGAIHYERVDLVLPQW